MAVIRGSLVGEEEPLDGSTVTATASAPSMEPSKGAAAAPVSFGSKSPAGSGTSSQDPGFVGLALRRRWEVFCYQHGPFVS